MDLISLARNISAAVLNINAGRKGFATRGKEQEGRIQYETGIEMAMSCFKEAQASTDPYALILAEYTFLSQELQLCDKNDKYAFNSLTLAIQLFEDAFLALKEVEGSNYKSIDNAIPHLKKYREKGYPKDAYHIACSSHITRIKNNLSSTGIDPIEKDVLIQRKDNMFTAQDSYIEMQIKALAK